MVKSEGKNESWNFLDLANCQGTWHVLTQKLSKSSSELQLDYGTEVVWGKGWRDWEERYQTFIVIVTG